LKDIVTGTFFAMFPTAPGVVATII